MPQPERNLISSHLILFFFLSFFLYSCRIFTCLPPSLSLRFAVAHSTTSFIRPGESRRPKKSKSKPEDKTRTRSNLEPRQSKAKQSKAKQSKAKQSKAKQSKAKQSIYQDPNDPYPFSQFSSSGPLHSSRARPFMGDVSIAMQSSHARLHSQAI